MIGETLADAHRKKDQMADPKTKTVVKVSLAFQIDAPDGIKGMAKIDAQLDEAVAELAASLGLTAGDIERTDRPQRVKA